MLEKYSNDVKLVIKNYPLRSHSYAFKAAVAALAAHRQGKFDWFHDQMIDEELNDEKILKIAMDLDLDLTQFRRDLVDPVIRQLILRDIAEGRQAGVNGIPAIFINGKSIENQSLEGFQQKIDAELKKRAEAKDASN